MAVFNNPKQDQSVQRGSEKSSEKSSEKILSLIMKNKFISASEMAVNIGVSQRAIEKQLSKLKKEARVKRIGTKGGYWEVIK